jgi:hypothetical protein
MGTDRTEYLRQPCPCGKGELWVDHCMPDHGWSPGAYWWEMGVRCNECDQKYAIVDREKKAVLIETSAPDKPIGEPLGELTQRAFYGPEYTGRD